MASWAPSINIIIIMIMIMIMIIIIIIIIIITCNNKNIEETTVIKENTVSHLESMYEFHDRHPTLAE